jgi:hypothetical protein
LLKHDDRLRLEDFTPWSGTHRRSLFSGSLIDDFGFLESGDYTNT